LPTDTSFRQLARENVDFALTVYASIGHELPFLGIKVINCSPNPHMAYDFNFHTYTKKEYNNLLLALPNLDKTISTDGIYEFYYIHYYYIYLDFMKKNNQSFMSGYKYFLDDFDEKKHNVIKIV